MFDFLRLARTTWPRQGRGNTSCQRTRGEVCFRPRLEILEERTLLSLGPLIGLQVRHLGTGHTSIVSLDPSNPTQVNTLLPETADYGLGNAMTVETDGNIDFSAIPNATYNPGPLELFRFNPGTGEVTHLAPGVFFTLATASDGKVIGGTGGSIVSIDPGNNDAVTPLLPASAGYHVGALTVEADGNIDFAGSNSGGVSGLYRLHPVTGNVNLINSNDINALTTTPDGKVLFVATADPATFTTAGLFSMDPGNGDQVTPLWTPPSGSDTYFVPNEKSAVAVEPDGHIDFVGEILGNSGDNVGLFRFDPSTGQTQFNYTSSLPFDGTIFEGLASPGSGTIKMESIRAVDSHDVIVRYAVESFPYPGPFQIGIYRSSQRSQYVPSPSETLPVGSFTVSGQPDLAGQNDLAKGEHEVLVPLTRDLAIDPFHKFVLAVADPGGQGAMIDRTPVSFRIVTVGAVAEGLTIRVPFTFRTPGWVDQMVSALLRVDAFDYAIPFKWQSFNTKVKADHAGHMLALQIKQLIGQLQLQSSDVIDLQLIGHSRGSVVICNALADLIQAGIPQLAHGYKKLTFLDPHPAAYPGAANKYYGLNASFPRFSFGVQKYYLSFEKKTMDGPVFIPAGTNEAEDYYQQTDHALLTGKEKRFVNLWGLDPSQIIVAPHTNTLTFFSRVLTGVYLPEDRRKIGHSEITDWYQFNILDTGAVLF
jgi:hypothetical protein